MSGLDAIKAVYEGKIVTFNDAYWIKEFVALGLVYNRLFCGSWSVHHCLDKKYFDQNKWYIVKNES